MIHRKPFFPLPPSLPFVSVVVNDPAMGIMGIRSLILAAMVTASSLAQLDEVANFCAIGGSSVAVVDDKAYIFGGWSNWNTGGGNYTGPNDYLRVIDFSKSVRTSQDVSQYVDMIKLPDAIPRQTYSYLWNTNGNNIDMMMGFHEPSNSEVLENDTAATKVWPLTAKHSYDLTNNNWTSSVVASRGANLEMVKIGPNAFGALQKPATKMSVWVPGLKKGFALGGESYIDATNMTWNNPRQFDDHHGFLIYDLENDVWSNQTMPVSITRMGVLTHLETENDDILITFGGYTTSRNGPGNRLRSMGEFDIYSTAKNKWYSYVLPETATVPAPRGEMCWSVASAQDGSSHQIVMYGGLSGGDFQVETTVWALSLPSFDWVQLSGNSSDPSRLPGARIDPICATVGNRYMLSWGGRAYSQTDNSLLCDADGNNVFILDISSGQWVDQYTPGSEYLVPDAVVSAIGGNGTGGATKLAPDGGFDDTELAAIMKFKTTSTSNGTTSVIGSSSTSSTVTSHTGAIAGGVVGGLAAVAALGLGFFLYRRRSNKNSAGSAEAGLPPELDPEVVQRVEAPAAEYAHEVPADHKYGYYGGAPKTGGSPLTPEDENSVYTELQGDMPDAITTPPVQQRNERL